MSSKNDPDKLYYDVIISNLDNESTIPPLINFNETRNIPFLTNPADYYMSIIRFQIDTGSVLPVFTPSLVRYTSDINETIYSVSLSYNGVNAVQHVIWSPQNLVAPLPAPPSNTADGYADLSTGYYYCSNYQFFLNLVNNAFSACLTKLALLTQVPSPNAPFFTYNSQDKTFILNAPFPYYLSTEVNPVKIFLNPSLNQLFSSFPVLVRNLSSVYGQHFEVQVGSFNGIHVMSVPSYAPVAEQYQVCQIFQESSTIALWTPVSSIVFTSSTLPVVSNQVSAPLIFINGRTQPQSGNNSNISPIITDLVSSDGLYNPTLVYNPTAEYRLIELLGNKPLQNLDIQVFYRDRNANLIPMRLPSGGVCTLKILFTKRSSNALK